MKRLKQLGLESIVYGLSGVISRFLSFLLVPIYTRIFTPEDYGVISLVSTTIAVVSIFAVLALDNSAHRWYWDTEDLDDRKRTIASWAWCQFTVSALFALVIFNSADWLGRLIIGRADAGLYLQLTAAALPLGVLGGVVNNWFRMQRRPWATTMYALGTSLLSILLTILLVIGLKWGLQGVYVAQLITAGVGTVVAAWLMRDWLNPQFVDWKRLREMLRFGLPLIPAGLAFWTVNLSDRYFLKFYASTDEVGLYAVGGAIAAFVALGTGAFQQAWGPFALSIHKEPDAKQVYANALLAYLWLTSLISTALALLAPEMIRLIATESYLGAHEVVGLIALSYVMIGLGYIASLGPGLMKHTMPVGIAITVSAFVNIGLNFVLVPRMGKQGAALAAFVSQSIAPAYLFYRSQQLYPIPYRFKPAIALLALAGMLMWIGSGWHFENLWMGVVAKVGLLSLFIPALFILGIVTPGQARRLFRPATADVM